MACHGKSLIHSRASPSPKGNKPSRRGLNFPRSRTSLASVLLNRFWISSTRQMFVLILFVTVILVHTYHSILHIIPVISTSCCGRHPRPQVKLHIFHLIITLIVILHIRQNTHRYRLINSNCMLQVLGSVCICGNKISTVSTHFQCDV